MRILIDCTGINIHRRLMTGIPRVVQNYLRLGYAYGAQHGVAVVPVVVFRGELVAQSSSRAFPAPKGLRRRSLGSLMARLLQFLFMAVGYSFFALFWAVLCVGDLLRGRKPDPRRITARVSGPTQVLLEPADHFQRLYLRAGLITPTADDILFCPAYWHDVDPAVYQKLRGQLGGMYVLVHDVIPVSHPHLYHAPWRDMFRENVRAALGSFDGVIAISHYTANMLRRLFPTEAAAAAISVCHNGLEPLAPDSVAAGRYAGHFPPDRRPFLMVGTIEPKKGHLLVLQALEQLWDQGVTQRSLVIIGRRGWMYDDILKGLSKTRHRDKVIWIQDASDAELAMAYRGAHLLIHGSTVEGFGLPLVECASFGTPVVANWSEIALEVLGPHGLFFQNSAETLAAQLRLQEDPGVHAAQRALMADFHWQGWDETVPALFAALQARHDSGTPLPEVIAPPVAVVSGAGRG